MTKLSTEPPTQGAKHSILKLTAAAVSVVWALSGLYLGSFGDVYFAAIMAFIIFFDEWGFSAEQKLASARVNLQNFYRNGDKLARAFILVVAVGGNALVIDWLYNLDVIALDLVDTWIKRISPALIISSATLILVTFFSKFFYSLNLEHSDNQSLRIEVCLYLSASMFMIFNFIFWMGVKVESILPSKNSGGKAYNFGQWSDLSTWFNNFLISSILISLIWLIASTIWSFSRYAEFFWKKS
ncbi:hypothetical protein [Sinorhizobium medicae]|uniref:hypothetical protein n=1 Tax=Sinorhizobium medicae TaxID=110321 RepID=UPI0011997D11|nr:hypothetical protein [Sinorhizobium medicae]MDX0426882.1 hypothetical protein [Sinorhizobium medicae]TWA22723.1 hypothetical protein FB006_10913 [Sinorhizobium medicae]TWA43021.1 hypothetical protein FB005_10913 [Sinorhizobium medicae]